MKYVFAPLAICAVIAVAGYSHAQSEQWVGSGDGWALDLGSTRLANGIATTRLVVTTVPQQSTPIPWDYVIMEATFDCQARRATYPSKTFHTVSPVSQRTINVPEANVAIVPGSVVEKSFNRACGQETVPSYLTRFPSARAYYDTVRESATR